jgi:tetratricopeptide (TPR) repeat protein
MGSKLTVLAAVIGLGGTAVADNPAALKKGIELYKAGKYAEARVQIEKAYNADKKPETLFALAQAERLAGDCMAAAGHYKQVISEVNDLNVAKLVQQNLLLCEPDDDKPEAKPEAAKPVEEAGPVEPKIVERTVIREERRTDKLAAVMLGGGMLALGAAG